MESLRYLMGAYFHQDFDLDGGTSADTVSSFLHERTDLVTAAADDIDALLAEDLPEGALMRRLSDWGCDYHAGDSDEDYRRWLASVRDQIRESLAS